MFQSCKCYMCCHVAFQFSGINWRSWDLEVGPVTGNPVPGGREPGKEPGWSEGPWALTPNFWVLPPGKSRIICEPLQILAAFPQTLIDLFVRMQKLGTQTRVLPERQLVSEGCLVWSLPWSRRVSWRQGDGPAYFCSSSLGGWKRPVHKVGDAEGGGHLLPQGAFPAEVGMHAHFSFLTQSNILCISTADAQMRRACDREVMVLDFHFLSGWNCSCMLLVGLSCFWQAHFPLGSSKAMEMSRCMSCHHPWLCHTFIRTHTVSVQYHPSSLWGGLGWEQGWNLCFWETYQWFFFKGLRA